MLPPKRLCRVGHDVTTGSCADALDYKHILRHDEVPIDTTSSEQPKCDGVHAVLFESKIQTPRFRLQIPSPHQTPGTQTPGTQTPDTYSYGYLYPKPLHLYPDHNAKSLDHQITGDQAWHIHCTPISLYSPCFSRLQLSKSVHVWPCLHCCCVSSSTPQANAVD